MKHRCALRNSSLSMSFFAMANLCHLGSARAQDFAAASGNDGSEAIIVTAQKRAQSLQQVPSSIAVIRSENIGETGKDSIADYVNTVPGLSVATRGPGTSTLAIRGVTTGTVRNDEPQNKETVGVYLDDTPISVNGFNPDLGLFDVDRIEVLRGPQGTLYGAGSMGGAIRIITNRPDPSKLAGLAEGSISGTSHGGANYELRGMINLPLANDALALRTIAYGADQSGYIGDTATGEHEVNNARTRGLRAQLGAKIGENLDASLAFMVHDLKTGSGFAQSAPFQRAVRAFDGISDNLKAYSATLNYQLDGATITSATSYLDKRNVNRTSLERLLSAALAYNSPSPLVDTTHVEDFTQELRIVSSAQSPFNYLFGLFFQHHKRGFTQDGTVPGIDRHVGIGSIDLGTPQPDGLFYGTQNIDEKQWAAFGEVSYELAPGLAATAGLRAFSFNERYNTYGSGLLNGGITASVGQTSESGLSPKFSLSFLPGKDHQIYATVSKGYRLGGVNSALPADLCKTDLDKLGRADGTESYSSDSVWNYEIGTKNQSADHSLTLNASAYYIKWNNMQTTLSLPTCHFSFRTNVGKARSVGLELEARYRPAARTEIYGTLGITDSRLTEDVPFTTWKAGSSVPAVSPVQLNLGLRQGLNLFGGKESFFRLDYSFVSKAHSNFDTQASTNRYFNDYSLFNIAFGTKIPKSPLELTLFARNLFDSQGRVAAFAGDIIAPERFVTVLPRTIGVTLRASFMSRTPS